MIIFLADAHLKPHIWQTLREVENDTFIAFQQVVDFAKENDAAAIILGGDTFDPPSSLSIKKYEEIVKDFEGDIYAIEGQHDRADPSWFSIPSVTGKDVHNKVFTIEDQSFYALSNMPQAELKKKLENLPDVDYLILHQLAKGMFYSWNFDPKWISDFEGTTLMGDLHIATPLDSVSKVYYNGSLTPNNITEIPRKHRFLMIEDGLKEEQLIEREMLDIRFFDQDFDFLYKTLEEVGGPGFLDLKPLIFITYDVSIPDIKQELDRIRNKYQDFIFDLRPEMSKEFEEDIRAGRDMIDLISEFTQDESMQIFLENLLNADDQTVIDKLRKQFNLSESQLKKTS